MDAETYKNNAESAKNAAATALTSANGASEDATTEAIGAAEDLATTLDYVCRGNMLLLQRVLS